MAERRSTAPITPPFCPPRRPRAAAGSTRGRAVHRSRRLACRGPYQAASSQLAASPLMRGQRSAMSRREALILQCLLNHPWLLHDHLEEVAALELPHPRGAQAARRHHRGLRQPTITIRLTPPSRARSCARILQRGGFSQVLQRVDGAITTACGVGRKGRRGAGGCSFHLAPARLLASPVPLLT